MIKESDNYVCLKTNSRYELVAVEKELFVFFVYTYYKGRKNLYLGMNSLLKDNFLKKIESGEILILKYFKEKKLALKKIEEAYD